MGGKLSNQSRGALSRRLGRPRTVGLDIGSASEFENPSARPTVEMQREAWDRNAAPRSITSWLCGDPPPGHSALDKMRALA